MSRSAYLLASLAAATSVLLSACGATPDQNHTPAGHSIAFTVNGTGTADITWSGPTTGSAPHTTLPWHVIISANTHTHPATVAVTLGSDGGHATCDITIDGHQVTTSLAQGPFGKATCRTATSESADG
jgi:hypothetical protein